MDSDDQTSSDEDHYDSDKELQIAFQKGLLKPGLNLEIETEKKIINDVDGLKQALNDLKDGLPWIERLDLTVTPLAPPKPLAEQLGSDPDDLTGDAVHDDFKREMRFYRQAQAAVLEGIPKLHKLGVPTRRPEDYLAEMSKSDRHMKKVREKLLAKQVSMERSEKAKKLRELRKYGKKIQHEVLLKRQKEKRDMLDAMKKFRKGKQDKLDFLEEKKGGNEQRQQQKGKEIFEPNKKRQKKNTKYGFGGQKKRSKSNTADSANDMSQFSKRKHGAVPKKFINKNKKKNRPGKKRRQKGQSNNN